MIANISNLAFFNSCEHLSVALLEVNIHIGITVRHCLSLTVLMSHGILTISSSYVS